MGAKWIAQQYVIEIRLPSPQIIQGQYFGRGATNTEFQAELDTYFCTALLRQHPNFYKLNRISLAGSDIWGLCDNSRQRNLSLAA